MGETSHARGSIQMGSGILRWLPGITAIRTYRREDLRGDLIAGLAVTALLVPAGMAYAELAGLPPITGLYTTVMCLAAYAVFGPSPIMVLGPDSSLSPMIFATILPLIGANGDPNRAIALASALALMMGVVCIAAGTARLGVLTDLLSMPLRVGYINGIAVVVLVSQLPKLCGFSVDSETTQGRLREFFTGLTGGEVNGSALAIGLACLVLLFSLKFLLPKVPGVLIAVIGGSIAVAALGLVAKGVPVVGAVPSGFPAPALPSVSLDDLTSLAVAAVGIAFVTLADTSALSRTMALKYHRKVNPSQEIVALGLANMAAGMFQGFAISASQSRTAVADSSGARTQLVGVVGLVAVSVLLLFAGSLTTYLPSASLAAIVIVAGTALFDYGTMRWLWRVRITEFGLCLAALLGVVFVGVLEGIVIAIVLSIIAFMMRLWRPYQATLGRMKGRHGNHDMKRHPDALQPPGMIIFRFDAPLFFANAEYFARCVKQHIADSPEPVRHVVIAGEPITDIDTTGAEALGTLADELEVDHVSIAFAEIKGPVKDRLIRYGVYERIGQDNFFPTLNTAVADFLERWGEDPAEWVDDYDGSISRLSDEVLLDLMRQGAEESET